VRPCAQESQAEPAKDERLERILEKVGESVARYQSGLFSIAFAETFDVLRLGSHLAAPFEFDGPRAFGFGRLGPSRHFKYAAQDYLVRFRRRQFKDPEQTLLVPEYAERTQVIEGASKPRTRATLRLSDYRRYRSDVKIIEEPDN
jgi:hypothetical protein